MMRAVAASHLALFAYGSLVNPASASQTLGRPVRIAARARLEGWRRTWGVARDNLSSEKTFARADGTLPRYCLGLDLEPAAGAPAPNGALIEFTAPELDRLDLRELRYRRVDVTDAVRLDPAPDAGGEDPGFDRVYAYRSRPEHHHPVPPPDAIVIATYLAAVESAFDALGSGERERFRATTAAPPAPVTDASLVRDRIPAGNPRAW